MRPDPLADVGYLDGPRRQRHLDRSGRGGNRFSTVRSPITTPSSLARSWRMTSALPASRKKRSRSQPLRRPAPITLGSRERTTRAKVAAHRVARAAKLLREALRLPAKSVQSHHRRHLIRVPALCLGSRSDRTILCRYEDEVFLSVMTLAKRRIVSSVCWLARPVRCGTSGGDSGLQGCDLGCTSVAALRLDRHIFRSPCRSSRHRTLAGPTSPARRRSVFPAGQEAPLATALPHRHIRGC